MNNLYPRKICGRTTWHYKKKVLAAHIPRIWLFGLLTKFITESFGKSVFSMLHKNLMLAPCVLLSTVCKRGSTPIHQIWTLLSERQEMATMWSGFGNIRTRSNLEKSEANERHQLDKVLYQFNAWTARSQNLWTIRAMSTLFATLCNAVSTANSIQLATISPWN